MVSQWVTFKIQHNQGAARKFPQFCDQFDHLAIWKVMQNRRAKHEIESVWQERELKGISRHPWRQRATQVKASMMKRDHPRVPKTAPNELPHVSGSSAHVKNRKLLPWVRQIFQHAKQSTMTTEPAINAGDVAQIAVRKRRGADSSSSGRSMRPLLRISSSRGHSKVISAPFSHLPEL